MLSRAVALTLTALAVAFGAIALPAAASAAITAKVAVNETAGSTAASTGSVGVALNFAATTAGDAVKNVSIVLPPGLFLNEELNGGACLTTPTLTSACQIGSGTTVIAGVSTPTALYLVPTPANTSGLAGIALVAGGLAVTGDLNFYSSDNVGISPSFDVSDELTFNGLPAAGVTAMSLTLTGLTFPSSCQPATLTVRATSQLAPNFPVTASTSFTTTNCLSLSTGPGVTGAISRDAGSTSANASFTITNPAGFSAIQTLKIKFPANLTLNPAVDPCFDGTPCTVGTVKLISPLVPASQLSGTLVLAGTLRTPSLEMNFPAPTDLQLFTIFGQTSLGIYDLPQLPLTQIDIDMTGTQYGGLFVAQCYSAIYTVSFAPWNGAVGSFQNSMAKIGNCANNQSTTEAARPAVRAAIAGLAAGAPKLTIAASSAIGAPKIQSVRIGLPKGLHFAGDAAITKRSLSASGGRIAGARVSGGALLVSFRPTAAHVSLTVSGRLLVESSTLQSDVARHAAGNPRVVVGVTDGGGNRIQLKLAVSPH